MDHSLLAQVVEELSSRLSRGKIERVFQDSDGNICIAVHRSRERSVLLLSADREHPRLHLLSRKPLSVPGLSGFALYLRSHLPGSGIIKVGLLNNDRIVQIGLRRPGREYALIFELFGPAPNLLLLDQQGVILALLRTVAAGERARRPLMPGMVYAPPDLRLPPAPADREPPIAATAGTPVDGSGDPANRAAEEWYDRLLEQRRTAALRRELAAALKKARSRLDRRMRAVSGDLEAMGRSDEHRRAGEAIFANLARISKGDASASLQAYDGTVVAVALDPLRSPVENAERCFRRYKKAKSGRALAERRLEDGRAEERALRSLTAGLDAAADRESLMVLRSAMAKRGIIESGRSGARAPRGRQTTRPYRAFEEAGWQILVGRTAAGNDQVTTKLARPGDLWLHADGLPGSHVLVRNPGRREIPHAVLARAASLAAHFSKGRGAGKVPVAYTDARFVKKPKGAKPGMVTLSRRKTIMAAPDGWRGAPERVDS